MAFTFTEVLRDPVNGVATYTATTNTASAAGTINPGFEPSEVTVYQTTTPITYRWAKGFGTGDCNKVIANGTQTTETSDGIDVTGPSSATATIPTVTLGTGLHTNSAAYIIVLRR